MPSPSQACKMHPCPTLLDAPFRPLVEEVADLPKSKNLEGEAGLPAAPPWNGMPSATQKPSGCRVSNQQTSNVQSPEIASSSCKFP